MITNTITYDRPQLQVEYDYVGIIDGLRPNDRASFQVTEELRSMLNGYGVTTALAEVASRLEMLGALQTFEREAVAGKRFMLHFVSHGNENAVGAGSEPVDWATLRPSLQRINSATNNSLLLNMSTCKGLHGAKIVDTTGQYPFFGLIGARENLMVLDALDANKRLYAKWVNGMPVQQIVPAINQEMGREILFNISAEGFRKLSS